MSLFLLLTLLNKRNALDCPSVCVLLALASPRKLRRCLRLKLRVASAGYEADDEVLRCFHSYAVDAGTIPAKAKKGRTKSKLGSRKAFSLEENQLEVQQQSKSLSRQVPPRYDCVALNQFCYKTD